MDYWSQGLGRRSALSIGCTREEANLTIQDARTALSRVVPSLVARLDLPEGEKLVLSGETRPPIVWRYVTLLGVEDLRSILRLAMSPEAVTFLTRFPGRKKLFLKLGFLMGIFLTRYLGVWIAQKLKLGFKEIRVRQGRNEGVDLKEKEIETQEKVEISADPSFPQR